jgi:hypothetical protein
MTSWLKNTFSSKSTPSAAQTQVQTPAQTQVQPQVQTPGPAQTPAPAQTSAQTPAQTQVQVQGQTQSKEICDAREPSREAKFSELQRASTKTLLWNGVRKLVSVLPIFDKIVKVADLVKNAAHFFYTYIGEHRSILKKKFNSYFISLSASLNKYFYVLRAKIEAATIYRDLLNNHQESRIDKVLINIYMLDITIIENKLDDLINVFSRFDINSKITSNDIPGTLETYRNAIETISLSIESAFTLLHANLVFNNELINQLKQKLHESTEFVLLNSKLKADDCDNIDFPLMFDVILKTSEQLQFIFDTVSNSVDSKIKSNNEITQEEFEKIKEKKDAEVKKELGCTDNQTVGPVAGFGTQCLGNKGGSKKSKTYKKSKKSKKRKTYKRRN